VGKNYRDHVEELRRDRPEKPGASGPSGREARVPAHPIIFTKPPSTVIADGDEIFPHPGLTAELDYEAELAVIIGRAGRGIVPERALDHVWGYTVVNDVTARDLQRAHRQWFLGKGLDTFCPMGPWAVTAGGFDLATAEVSCRVNGELRQKANVADLIFAVPALVAAISAGITLYPGDVIATGTPAGVGMAFDPPRFLQPGDVTECAVTGIGTLRNTVSRRGESTLPSRSGTT
jgi:2-keto-4-pentenoate hydratase/2-oxohepta-3-ene-1,7-dioic acid hydratase in catechol pathway